jgi:hypothetical protein
MSGADGLVAVTDAAVMTADGGDGETCTVDHDGHCQGFH